ncbi:benzoate/H(+) symporter BenE family transporter [Stagnihabitans tardus]|uniref:Benzoate/H(+) symporter BenE family transporter n=1 Tax=Stagnihabitans tardus TaxID=2699202 RepID=A0AAE4YBU8_9RHOB|nr:benzoate/H(+) symporter BenE family transporter [Stagnihabitans tardus]NBZ89094.1 benzoate/H(+) symporter BenE family transporter [Stagnihabitans tardus]
MRLSMISAALVAALVGFGSTIALVLAAAAAVGASPAQTASWVTTICLVKALGSAFLSTRARVPVVLAWSTPGAALIAATQGLTMAEAVGAFLLAGALIAASGAIKPLGALISRIPDALASAMLAGVLLPFCLKGFAAAPPLGLAAAAMIATFALVRLKNPALAVLAALAMGLIAAFWGAPPSLSFSLPELTFIPPAFSTQALIGLGLPLYLVTMASQNLPGFATQRAAGYEPQVAPALITTGGLSALGALFGAHTISMAAITAAICMGDDVHPDRSQRWKVGLLYALAWVLLGLLSPEAIALLRQLPAEILTLLVGLALLGPLTGALTGAFAAAPPQRFAATITLTVTASGLSLLGVGAAFWGLLAGLAVLALDRLSPKRP